jgi:hypothetical protein
LQNKIATPKDQVMLKKLIMDTQKAVKFGVLEVLDKLQIIPVKK